jgi:hypothetical protein
MVKRRDVTDYAVAYVRVLSIYRLSPEATGKNHEISD